MTLGFVSPSLSCFLYLAYAFLENPHLAVVAATLIPLALFASTARMNRSLSLSETFVPDARTKNAGAEGPPEKPRLTPTVACVTSSASACLFTPRTVAGALRERLGAE